MEGTKRYAKAIENGYKKVQIREKMSQAIQKKHILIMENRTEYGTHIKEYFKICKNLKIDIE